jgi:SAM-dependent methyltransferase
VEARFYQEIDLPSPVLDVGCGDGHFAATAFDRPLDVGLDPWGPPIREAARYHGYKSLVQADGGSMPFPDAYFASAVSNSVLEHIPHLEAVLAEAARVLRPGAAFAFCVPNHNFNPQLSIARSFDRLGLSSWAGSYRLFFNRIARHRHLDPPEVWSERLERAGFEVERWWHYFSPAALRPEWGIISGCHSLVARQRPGAGFSSGLEPPRSPGSSTAIPQTCSTGGRRLYILHRTPPLDPLSEVGSGDINHKLSVKVYSNFKNCLKTIPIPRRFSPALTGIREWPSATCLSRTGGPGVKTIRLKQINSGRGPMDL